MPAVRRAAAAAGVLAGLAAIGSLPGLAGTLNPEPLAVVALIDTGINPYNVAFRDRSPIAYRHPSTYIPGYPKTAPALRVTLDVPYAQAMARDAKLWASVRPATLYWIPGTRIVGAISFGSGGTNCPYAPAPPANSVNGPCTEHAILDDHGHGTMTASRAAGSPHSLAPQARIVEIEGLGGKAVRWAADRGWIDVQSNSWIDLTPPPASGLQPEDDGEFWGYSTSNAFAHAVSRTVTIAASGNGAAYLAGAAPTPTYVLSTAPPGVILVGGHDNGRATLWAGAPPHVVADAYAGYAAVRDSSTAYRPDPIACCTSAAAPYAAGGATAIVREARRILGDRRSGIRNGVVARGPARLVSRGPLADGVFTLEELRRVFLATSEAIPRAGRDDGDTHWTGDGSSPELVPYGLGSNPFCAACTTTPYRWDQAPQGSDLYPFVGYGAINERSVALASRVLRGLVTLPGRAAADGHYAQDQELREVFFLGTNGA
jgi:hypothetical protein